jgi:hypothetical protein
LIAASGCTSTIIRSQGPETASISGKGAPRFVGDVARPWGLGDAVVECVSLVTGLSGTGEDPPQSSQRQALIQEMQRHDVRQPDQVLASPHTALVLVRAVLPPGINKGDRIDVEVRAPSRSKATSLAGGWLMESRLHEVAVIDSGVRSGHVRALAEGPVLINSLLEGAEDAVGELRGAVLEGGVATQSRPVGLKLKSEHHSVAMSKLIGDAINRRFDTYVRGHKQGAAVPKRDNFIELVIHPRYAHNLIRYFRVIEQLPLRVERAERPAELAKLKADLLIPETASVAALRLEAIGDEASSVLLSGLESSNPEIRFYAAEALAYLDVTEAAAHLAVAARNESAFRSRALTALGTMSSVEAHDELTSLLHLPSAETRYGAFRALQAMNPRDPLIGGDLLDGQIHLHEIATTGPAMVHIARSHRAEIVLFDPQQALVPPVMLFAGKQILVKGEAGDVVRITRHSMGDDSAARCSTRLSDVLRQCVELGATYPDLVQLLLQGRRQGCLASRLTFDALPTTGRRYHRASADEDELVGEEEESAVTASGSADDILESL